MHQRSRHLMHPGGLAALVPIFPFVLAATGCEPPPEDAEEVDEPTERIPLEIAAAAAPDPGTVHITGVKATGGTGCPQGSVAAGVTTDGLSLVVLFKKYTASMGPGIPLTASRVNCTLNLGIHVPDGFTFTVTQIDNRGSVNIPAGVRARQQSSYRMDGVSGGATPLRTEFKGPAKRNFVASNTFESSTQVFSRCGIDTSVNVATSLVLTGSRAEKSTISIDSLNQSFSQRFRMAWRRCN